MLLLRGIRSTTQDMGPKILIASGITLLTLNIYLLTQPSASPRIDPIPAAPLFIPYGESTCLPQDETNLAENSVAKRGLCRKYSPFLTRQMRIATVTAHFGTPKEHYQQALQTHLLHSLIHGTETHVLCDAIVDDLWNKPAFILRLLMDEMMKPDEERLEWIMWVDRDTIILDQCRPASSFLPRYSNETYLLVTNDFNGLNNGVFMLRVNSWAVELFNTILAFRHYKPEVELRFTEQSAMELVIKEDQFKDKIKFVPQYWFNGYPEGEPEKFKDRRDQNDLQEEHVRRGDFLVHFAGLPGKGKAIRGWLDMLAQLEDVWKTKSAQRDVDRDIAAFWHESVEPW
ncbi:hypothetical protein E8E13_000925 [Curvularia kusanoi]|uniref:Galactosyl transferase GMA12/MNN10 family protein n=1 Tax=Curvularia kusanoi TaxID=90978 RepID=A0A9P4T691_CURKU|nr:hypothetical protein E8E13_000925 [Curvularia kusanoi]